MNISRNIEEFFPQTFGANDYFPNISEFSPPNSWCKWIFRKIFKTFSPKLLGEIIISQIFRNSFHLTILAIQNWKCDVLHVWCGILIRVWVNTGSHLQFKFQAKLGVAEPHKHFSCHCIECANVVTHQSILPFPKKRQSKSYLKGITSFKLATTSL